MVVLVFHFVSRAWFEGLATAPLPLPLCPATSFSLRLPLPAYIGARIEGCEGRSTERRTCETEAEPADRGDGEGVAMLDALIAASVKVAVVGEKRREV